LALRQNQLAAPDQAEFVLCKQTILAVSRPIMVTLIVGGSFPADPLDPHRGILLAMGLSTPS